MPRLTSEISAVLKEIYDISKTEGINPEILKKWKMTRYKDGSCSIFDNNNIVSGSDFEEFLFKNQLFIKKDGEEFFALKTSPQGWQQYGFDDVAEASLLSLLATYRDSFVQALSSPQRVRQEASGASAAATMSMSSEPRYYGGASMAAQAQDYSMGRGEQNVTSRISEVIRQITRNSQQLLRTNPELYENWKIETGQEETYSILNNNNIFSKTDFEDFLTGNELFIKRIINEEEEESFIISKKTSQSVLEEYDLDDVGLTSLLSILETYRDSVAQVVTRSREFERREALAARPQELDDFAQLKRAMDKSMRAQHGRQIISDLFDLISAAANGEELDQQKLERSRDFILDPQKNNKITVSGVIGLIYDSEETTDDHKIKLMTEFSNFLTYFSRQSNNKEVIDSIGTMKTSVSEMITTKRIEAIVEAIGRGVEAAQARDSAGGEDGVTEISDETLEAILLSVRPQIEQFHGTIFADLMADEGVTIVEESLDPQIKAITDNFMPMLSRTVRKSDGDSEALAQYITDYFAHTRDFLAREAREAREAIARDALARDAMEKIIFDLISAAAEGKETDRQKLERSGNYIIDPQNNEEVKKEIFGKIRLRNAVENEDNEPLRTAIRKQLDNILAYYLTKCSSNESLTALLTEIRDDIALEVKTEKEAEAEAEAEAKREAETSRAAAAVAAQPASVSLEPHVQTGASLAAAQAASSATQAQADAAARKRRSLPQIPQQGSSNTPRKAPTVADSSAASPLDTSRTQHSKTT